MIERDGEIWTRVARETDLRGEGPHAVAAAGIDLVVVRGRTGLRAYEAHCPHQGALLGEGELEGDQLICRNHRWRFDVTTGQRTGGTQCLTACPVRTRSGDIEVDARALVREEAAAAPTRTIDDLPGPRGLPLVGSLFDLDPKKLHLSLEAWVREYGPYYVVNAGPRRLVVISDPPAIQAIFRARPDTYRRLSTVESVFDEMGVSGVFSAEGAAWRPQRRLAMEALSHRHLRGFYPTMRSIADRLRRRWVLAAESGRELDLGEELRRFTVDVTTLLVFGRDLNTIEHGDDDVVQHHLRHLFPMFNRRLNAVFPYWRYIRLPDDRRLDEALGALKQWLDTIIEETRELLEREPERAEHPANFIESMLSAKDDDGRPFSDKVIFGNALTMLLAGEDTTANTVAWAVHHLADSPEATRKIAAEAREVLGTARVAADLDQTQRLTYAGAVANEAMRVRPVAPLLFFEPNHDTVLEGLSLPKGTSIVCSARPQVMSASRFAGPESFRPERWLEKSERGDGAHDPSVHAPFGSGPRICPGRSLALVEMKLVLSLLYRSFDVVRVGASDDVRERFDFTLMPDDLRIRLRRRA